METVAVVWLTLHDEVDPRRMWDQASLNSLFDRTMWRPVRPHVYTHHVNIPVDADGAVVVVSGRYHDKPADVAEINRLLAPLRWCVVVITSDEESAFPWRDLTHPNMRLWIMTPDPAKHPVGAARYIGSGWPPHAPALLSRYGQTAQVRSLDWMFVGQVTHQRRRECVAELRRMPRGLLHETPGFTQGLPAGDYFMHMADARFVPCPSGPVSPDSFRVFEALEAGCVPIADGLSPKGGRGYWQLLFGDDVPFPVVEDWRHLPRLAQSLRRHWPTNAVRVSSWWQAYKRGMVYWMDEDVTALSGVTPPAVDLADLITVLIPTSPIPSHPSLDIIRETVASLHEAGLGGCETIIMCDGVRDEQEHYRDAYGEYLRRLMWACEHEWPQTLPVAFDRHTHQAQMTREVLAEVRTPFVLFVEHDTPIVGPVPWHEITEALGSGLANVVRLYHEVGPTLHPEHRHLAVDSEPMSMFGVPMLRVMQWSQRPALARTDFYRNLMESFFEPGQKAMIEDVIHGRVEEAWLDRGEQGWQAWRIFVYHPEGGDIRRSRHLDGRGSDEKWPLS